MNLTTEDKKRVRFLAMIGLGAGLAGYFNFLSVSSSCPAAAPSVPSERKSAEPNATHPRQTSGTRSRSDEFPPTLHPQSEEEPIDPLHLELLTRMQDVKLDAGQRNLFQFNTAAPKQREHPAKPATIVESYPMPTEPVEPLKQRRASPSSPRFTPKYYGLATKQIDGKKTAFFLDGEDIILATEGMTVKRGFKLVKIASSSVIVQDSETTNELTVQISEDAGAAAPPQG
jgi:hypothetical protein